MLKFANFRSYLRATAALPFAMAALAAGHASPALAASQDTVLYAFQGGPADGGFPLSNLTSDSTGNLYGTTSEGGSGAGTVFRLAPDGTETMLYAFTGGNDGSTPYGGVVEDKAGNLYGTTVLGGANGNGAVFELAPDGTETVLYSFTGGSDGGHPFAGLFKGKGGKLYGTSELGGGGNGGGTIFELTKANGGGYTETVLHSFGINSGDGSSPYGNLIEDKAGNLYGTTLLGGADGFGTVFKLAPDGTETVLYSFRANGDGMAPHAGLIADKAGNLYGTTEGGGNSTNCDHQGCGTVFKVTPGGTETVLHSFQSGSDGAEPLSGLLADSKGNVYGTTEYGGGSVNANCSGDPSGCGTVFKLAPDGTETVLYAFSGGSDGWAPQASLIKDKPDGKAELFGTTELGGTGNGVIFEIKK